jgi:hypothetical protein
MGYLGMRGLHWVDVNGLDIMPPYNTINLLLYFYLILSQPKTSSIKREKELKKKKNKQAG